MITLMIRTNVCTKQCPLNIMLVTFWLQAAFTLCDQKTSPGEGAGMCTEDTTAMLPNSSCRPLAPVRNSSRLLHLKADRAHGLAAMTAATGGLHQGIAYNSEPIWKLTRSAVQDPSVSNVATPAQSENSGCFHGIPYKTLTPRGGHASGAHKRHACCGRRLRPGPLTKT